MSRHAIVITAGVGPREARAFVARLAEHLAALAAARGLLVDGATVVGDDPEAPRSIALAVVGDAPGALADQLGTHALVHRSAARGHAARKRWFAGVRCEPALPDADPAIALRADDLEISACRAGGPGGQHVNKVATAVRVRHRPSGIAVRAAAARSQRANLDEIGRAHV